MRLGLQQVKGFGEDDANLLIEHRASGYDSVRDLWMRSGLTRRVIEKLADADCFRSIGMNRRDALWAVKALDPLSSSERLPLFAAADAQDLQREPDIHLPPMPLGEHVINDYQSLSYSLKAHPLSFLRQRLLQDRYVNSEALQTTPGERMVKVAGLVLVRQRPGSAKGVIFATIEDETGVANIIVWPKAFEKYRTVILGSRCIGVRGRLQTEDGVIHVVAHHLEDLTPLLAEISTLADDMGGLANADEVRRPQESIQSKIKPARRLALMAENPSEPGADHQQLAKTKTTRQALPKGRNFH